MTWINIEGTLWGKVADPDPQETVDVNLLDTDIATITSILADTQIDNEYVIEAAYIITSDNKTLREVLEDIKTRLITKRAEIPA